MAQVEGHVSHLNAVVADEGLFKAALNPENACPGTLDPVADDPTTRYDSEINPGGVRCSVLDLLVNQLGPRPESVWTPQEKAVGHGFGGLPFSNAGVLYGLSALKAGTITTAQFVDLNVKVGGLDVDSQPTADRIQGDPASIANAYRTGLIDEANHLDEVAMINHGGPDPGLAHDYAHAFWTQERLMADQGNTDNRVMWFGPTPLIGDPSWANEALTKMDEWLSAVEKDGSCEAALRQDRRRPARRRHRPLCRRPARPGLRPGAAAGPPDPAQHARARRPADRSPTTRWPASCSRSTAPTSTSCSCRSPTTSGRPSRASSPTVSATGTSPASVRDPPRPGSATTLPVAGGGGVAYGGRNLRALPAHSAGGLLGPVFAPMLRK